MEEDPVEDQVVKLVEAIQQLQQRVAELELQVMPSTPQEVRDQREETARAQSRESRHWPWNVNNSAVEVHRLTSILQRTLN
jgi:hypothetical protein